MSDNETSSMKQKLNIEYLSLRQMDRVNQSLDNGDMFTNLRRLISALPPENREHIWSKKDQVFTSKAEWKTPPSYRKLSADPLNPIIANHRDDANYNPNKVGRRYVYDESLGDINDPDSWKEIREKGDVYWISPYKEETPYQDLDVLYDIVHEEYLDLGLTWKLRPRAKIRGKTNTDDPEHKEAHPKYVDDWEPEP